MKPVMLPFATKFVREWRKINLMRYMQTIRN